MVKWTYFAERLTCYLKLMRLLVIEDYAPIRNAVVEGLSNAGFSVDACADGVEGKWLAETGDYDVIILDLMLPKLDGLALLRSWREHGNDTHVLILSAKGTVPERIAGLNIGADDYLPKPFVFEELLSRVRALVRRKYGGKNPVIRIADLIVDTKARRVTRADQSIEMTAKEFALLEYLAHRSGDIVSRTEIWEHVYSFESNNHSNVVDVYISYLRKKIDRDGWKKLIHTRRGQGYLLGETT